MTNEFSSGGIVFNSQNQVLITQNSRSFNWGFPKGTIEEGQTVEQAALREVREEGGIEAKIIEKVDDSEFFYTREKQKYHKKVTYYLMEYISGDIKDHDWEVKEARWVSVEEALETLSFKNDKELLQRALDLQKKNHE